MRRPNQLVLIGVAFFVVGVIIVLLLARDDGGSSSSSGGSDTTPVLVAKEDIEANAKGSDVADKVEVKQVSISQKQPDALTSTAALANVRFLAPFKKGDQIVQSGLISSLTTVTPPEGKQAIAVRFNNVPGGAEYVQTGDLVNIYQVLPTGTTAAGAGDGSTPASGPVVKLLLTNVQVLAVNKVASSLNTQAGGTTATTLAPTQQRTSSGGEIDLVLALDTIDAEKVIFGSQIDANFLYVAKVGDKAPPAGATPGQSYDSILQEAPDAANAREAAGQ